MTQEDKDLLFKDLCVRLPYQLKVKIPTLQEDTIFTLVGICEDYITVIKDNGSYFDIYTSIDCFPLLPPKSSMTEEEKQELNNILEFQYYSDDSCMCESTDWLNANHFDYRGLIPKGIAIAVTKDNNPYKK